MRTAVGALAAAVALLAACGIGPSAPPATPRLATPAGDSPTTAMSRATDPRSTTPSTPTATVASPSPAPTEVDLTVTAVVTGLEVPWEVAFTPDGRTFVTERGGRLLELTAAGVEEVQIFPVDASGEAGLLGLAVSPDYAEDGLLYAYFTSADDNRVVRFEPGGEPEPTVTGIPKARNHDGGRIAFGPDGMLYIGTGDAGNQSSAQDPESLAGKILRVTPDGEPPGDNPFPGSPVWSLGHRNVQGLAWDRDGRLWASELGPDRDDEINLIEPGNNYGWPEVTGTADTEGFTDPVFVRQPGEASWSDIDVLVGAAIPQWEGDLVAAGLRGQRLWRLDLDGTAVTAAEELLVGEYGRLRTVTQAPDGSLWLLTSNRDGRGDPVEADDRILRLGPPR